jgi:hypothetical protein
MSWRPSMLLTNYMAQLVFGEAITALRCPLMPKSRGTNSRWLSEEIIFLLVWWRWSTLSLWSWLKAIRVWLNICRTSITLQGMQLSLLILMLRRSLVSSVTLVSSWWRTWALASVPLSMSLSVMLWLRRIIILSMLLLRAIRGPLRRVLRSPELQLHRGLLFVLLQRVLSFTPTE